jgi:hypothetical protein
MKPAKVRREDNFIDEIVEALKSVPKTRLSIVRDVVGALAEEKNEKRLKRARRKSLLKTPFCGIWQRRKDIRNGGSYARRVRQKLETRGDRH